MFSTINIRTQSRPLMLEERITRWVQNHELKSQGFIITSILTYASSNARSLWSTIQQNMPKNIFNFSIKYLNNTLATRKILSKWVISQSSACSFCLKTLQHVVSSCTTYLKEGRFNWDHNSILLYLAKVSYIIFQVLITCRPTFISITKHYYRGFS